MIERILTIGAHGFDRESFFRALESAGADFFLDIRARRGMRGAEYAFANSMRLQSGLAEAGIAYAHARDLAPTDEMRTAQYALDEAAGVAKRKRAVLGEEFIDRYRQQRLSQLDAADFLARNCSGARRPVFFCVEREPAACHRSLVADHLARELHVPLLHLMP